MRREVTAIDGLRAVVGHPNEAVANKVASRPRGWVAPAIIGALLIVA